MLRLIPVLHSFTRRTAFTYADIRSVRSIRSRSGDFLGSGDDRRAELSKRDSRGLVVRCHLLRPPPIRIGADLMAGLELRIELKFCERCVPKSRACC